MTGISLNNISCIGKDSFLNHPQYNLPVSQAAYLAEMLTTEPTDLNELYLDMVALWPDMTRDSFCCLVRRLRTHIHLKVNKRGVWVSKSVMIQIKDQIWLERCRVNAQKNTKKPGRIELKKIK